MAYQQNILIDLESEFTDRKKENHTACDKAPSNKAHEKFKWFIHPRKLGTVNPYMLPVLNSFVNKLKQTTHQAFRVTIVISTCSSVKRFGTNQGRAWLIPLSALPTS